MIAQPIQSHREAVHDDVGIWGFPVPELHDAYWKSKGVQVISRGSKERIQPEADLYLLMEPNQLVLFEIRDVSSRMAWNGVTVMRLRIREQCDDEYQERIVEDQEGGVERIDRIYSSTGSTAFRVVVTRRADHARIWQKADTRREAWQRIRRSVPYFRIEHGRQSGHHYSSYNSKDCNELLEQLVESWPDPWRAIDGISEIRPGVIGPIGAEIDSFAIPPVWIGANGNTGDTLIGPCGVRDGETLASVTSSFRVRTIAEIDPPEPTENVPEPDLTPRPLYSATKRLFDVAVSALVLIVVSPILVLIALAIVIDDGAPVLYQHRRQRCGGSSFRCWKFRTMRRDADDNKQLFATENQCDGPQFYIANDPRVTRIGRLLRRFHLDELPQFWNVLVGDMSIVGPRPSPNEENQFCPTWREIRLSVRPGITGLWQVERTRAPGLDFQEWIRFDTEYVQRMSLWLDAQILMKTLKKVVWKG